MTIGKCPMCLKTKQPVSSHLLPAALYRFVDPPDGDPIFFSSEVILASSRQLQHPLLCFDCEHILNSKGENWFVPQLARIDGEFPFFDLLTAYSPVVSDGDSSCYAAAQNPQIDVASVVHFAMGIFWKAAIHSWKGASDSPLIDLGRHVEPIRKYLLGDESWPADAVLMVGILPKPVKHIALYQPYQGSSEAKNNFLFYVPGVEFTLLLGQEITREQRTACFSANPNNPVIVVDFSPMLREIFRDVTKDAHRAANVQKLFKKPETN
ncbi:MAG: hypothetical protein WCC97_12060 [Candidatus Acidiferrales bacterium]